MKKKTRQAERLAVKRTMLTEEIASLKARLDFGHLPLRDTAELSRMIDWRKTALAKK